MTYNDELLDPIELTISIRPSGSSFLCIAKELLSGSSTSFGAETIGGAYNKALAWSFLDVAYEVDKDSSLAEIQSKISDFNNRHAEGNFGSCGFIRIDVVM